MSIIYSRPRLRLPKFKINNPKDKKQSQKRANILFIFLIAFITLKIVLDAVTPIFNNLCENKAISLATIISNYKANDIMKKHTYDELFTIEKNEDGTVSFIKANVVYINQITSDVALEIQEEINKQGRDNVEIALRKFYWNEIISRKRSWNKNKNIIYG